MRSFRLCILVYDYLLRTHGISCVHKQHTSMCHGTTMEQYFLSTMVPGKRAVLCWLFLEPILSQTPGVQHGGGGCATSWDCSLGGDCNASAVCECDIYYTGPHCDLLNFAPAVENNGLQVPGYYSWGGHALEDQNGTYHLLASFMCKHQSLASWTTASSIWRATAEDPVGPFTLQEMVAQPWSHNAMVAELPAAAGGGYVLYQIGDAAVDPSEWAPCYEPNSTVPLPPLEAAPRTVRPDSTAAAYAVYARTAPTLAGPWGPPGGVGIEVDTGGSWSPGVNGGNPAPYIYENGTVLLYFSSNPW